MDSYRMEDVLNAEGLAYYRQLIKEERWEEVRQLERQARKRYGGGIPPADGVFTLRF